MLPTRHVSISLPVEEASGVAEARRVAMELAEDLCFSEADIGRVGLVVTEAATNIVQHAERGEILLRPFTYEAPASLEMLALDKGPGMANVAAAMRDGFSTGGSSGHGLGAIARLATCFDISSAPGKGTALLARIGRLTSKRSAEPGLEWGAVCVAKRDEHVCGDAWAVTAGPVQNTVLVVDGLGHGIDAHDAASAALGVFEGDPHARPETMLRALHEGLRATRGAVAGVMTVRCTRSRDGRMVGERLIVPSEAPVHVPLSPGRVEQARSRRVGAG